ncbi:MAG: hypothetical protein ABIM30_06040, partial [candidate division WOR-3 bacterium]
TTFNKVYNSLVRVGYSIQPSYQVCYVSVNDASTYATTSYVNTGTYSPRPFYVGGLDRLDLYGLIDEWRVLNTSKPSDWLLAEQNQTSTATLTPPIFINITNITQPPNSLNKSFNISFNISYSNSPIYIYTTLNGVLVNTEFLELSSFGTLHNISRTLNLSGRYGVNTVEILAFSAPQPSIFSSSSRSFNVSFNVSNLLPPNNTVMSGAYTLFSYNTTNLHPIQCRLLLNNTVIDNSTINSSTIYSVPYLSQSPMSGTWFVSCFAPDNPSYIVNSTPFNISSVSNTLQNYTIISLENESILQAPQFLFYDINNTLNVLYQVNRNASIFTVIKTISNTTAERTFVVDTGQLNQFGLVMRLQNATTFLSFIFPSNSTAVFTTFNTTNISLGMINTTWNVTQNIFYDPYSYAYTKHIQNISFSNASYYLFMLPTTTGSRLIRVNTTFNSSNVSDLTQLASYSTNFAWGSIANNSNLTQWFFAAPKGSNPFQIAIYSYNGVSISELVTPDGSSYSPSDISRALVFFEAYGGNTYFVQSNLSVFVIRRLNDGLQWTQTSSSISSPSNFIFIDKDTFSFLSTENSQQFIYSCYFGGTTGNCTRVPLPSYGASLPFIREPLTTTKREINPLTGPIDVVTRGFISSTNNSTLLYYVTYSYDLKIRCFDEVNQTRYPFNVRVFSPTFATVMSPSLNLWGYVSSSSILGDGLKKVYALCPSGTNRMYVYDPNINPSFDVFALNSVPPNAYYTLLISDCFGQPSRETLVTVRRFMPDRQNFSIVEQAFSSLSGDAVLFLQPFANYELSFLAKDGFNISSSFIPGTANTIPVSLGCAGEGVVPTYSKEDLLKTLFYKIYARTDNGTAVKEISNVSFTIFYNVSSNLSNINRTNALLYFTPEDGERQLVLNLTSTNNSNSVFSYYAEQKGVYDAQLLIMVTAKNGTAPVLFVANARFKLVEPTPGVMSISAHLKKSFSGWAWLFITTILTMLAIGYLSRFTLDGAGIMGALFFMALSFLNPAEIYIGGGVVLSMLQISTIVLLSAIALVLWRYV